MNTPRTEADDAAVDQYDESHTIPMLDSPVETAETQAIETPSHLNLGVNLGYAEDIESIDDAETMDEFVEIHTLSLEEALATPASESNASSNSWHEQQDQRHRIETLEAIVFEGYNPNQPTLDTASEIAPIDAPSSDSQLPSLERPLDSVETHADSMEIRIDSIESTTNMDLKTADHLQANHGSTPLSDADTHSTKKSDNPFLPQQLLDRLNQGKRNLVEEIAQSSAALDASTAILREHARTDKYLKASHVEPKSAAPMFSKDRSQTPKQKIIDELVDEYLPVLAAELRKRLKKILDDSSL